MGMWVLMKLSNQFRKTSDQSLKSSIKLLQESGALTALQWLAFLNIVNSEGSKQYLHLSNDKFKQSKKNICFIF